MKKEEKNYENTGLFGVPVALKDNIVSREI